MPAVQGSGQGPPRASRWCSGCTAACCRIRPRWYSESRTRTFRSSAGSACAPSASTTATTGVRPTAGPGHRSRLPQRRPDGGDGGEVTRGHAVGTPPLLDPRPGRERATLLPTVLVLQRPNQRRRCGRTADHRRAQRDGADGCSPRLQYLAYRPAPRCCSLVFRRNVSTRFAPDTQAVQQVGKPCGLGADLLVGLAPRSAAGPGGIAEKG